MAQRLKTDWILFFTIVAMVCFGLVIVYSASSVMAELKYKWDMYFITPAIRMGGGVVHRADAVEAARLPALRSIRSGLSRRSALLRVCSCWSISSATSTAGFRSAPFAAAVGICQAGVIIFLAYFISLRLRAINDKHTLRPALLALGGVAAIVVADLGTAIMLVLTAAVLFFVAGLERRYILAAAGSGVVLLMC